MIGTPHVHHRVTDSTNERAKQLAAAGAPHGTLVTADEQTAGRGRQGRQWVAPPGRALLMSVVLHADDRTPLVPLAAAVAVCHAFPQADGIKWPNDVWVDGRKLAGILIETRTQERWAVIGVGMNLSIAPDEFPPELRETAVSLFGFGEGGRGNSRGSLPAVASAGFPPTPLTAAASLNRHLDRWVEAQPDKVLSAWRGRDALRGREISWDGSSGVADGVDDSGCLVVVGADGARSVLSAGEVHLRL